MKKNILKKGCKTLQSSAQREGIMSITATPTMSSSLTMDDLNRRLSSASTEEITASPRVSSTSITIGEMNSLLSSLMPSNRVTTDEDREIVKKIRESVVVVPTVQEKKRESALAEPFLHASPSYIEVKGGKRCGKVAALLPIVGFFVGKWQERSLRNRIIIAFLPGSDEKAIPHLIEEKNTYKKISMGWFLYHGAAVCGTYVWWNYLAFIIGGGVASMAILPAAALYKNRSIIHRIKESGEVIPALPDHLQ